MHVLMQVGKAQALQCKCLPIATNAPSHEGVEVPLCQSTGGFEWQLAGAENPPV
jgi:hypothetical protein